MVWRGGCARKINADQWFLSSISIFLQWHGSDYIEGFFPHGTKNQLVSVVVSRKVLGGGGNTHRVIHQPPISWLINTNIWFDQSHGRRRGRMKDKSQSHIAKHWRQCSIPEDHSWQPTLPSSSILNVVLETVLWHVNN